MECVQVRLSTVHYKRRNFFLSNTKIRGGNLIAYLHFMLPDEEGVEDEATVDVFGDHGLIGVPAVAWWDRPVTPLTQTPARQPD